MKKIFPLFLFMFSSFLIFSQVGINHYSLTLENRAHRYTPNILLYTGLGRDGIHQGVNEVSLSMTHRLPVPLFRYSYLYHHISTKFNFGHPFEEILGYGIKYHIGILHSYIPYLGIIYNHDYESKLFETRSLQYLIGWRLPRGVGYRVSDFWREKMFFEIEGAWNHYLKNDFDFLLYDKWSIRISVNYLILKRDTRFHHGKE